jgi:acetyl esterase/lipase
MGMPLLKDPTPFLALLESKDTVHSTSIHGSKDARVSYYVYLLQSGLFNSVLTGIPTLSQELAPLSEKEREKALPVEKRRLFPHLNVHKDLPPMFLLHGTKDSAVPIEESRNMKTLLEAVGVHVELVEVEGADHGFDTVKDSSEIAGLEKLVPFLLKYL